MARLQLVVNLSCKRFMIFKQVNSPEFLGDGFCDRTGSYNTYVLCALTFRQSLHRSHSISFGTARSAGGMAGIAALLHVLAPAIISAAITFLIAWTRMPYALQRPLCGRRGQRRRKLWQNCVMLILTDAFDSGTPQYHIVNA